MPDPLDTPQDFQFEQMVWNQSRSYLIWIYKKQILPRNLNLHAYMPNYSAFLLLSGSLEIINSAGFRHATNDQWVFLRPGNRQQIFSENAEVLSINFHLTLPGNLQPFNWPTAAIFDKSDFPELERYADSLEQTVDHYFPDACTTLVSCPGTFATHLHIQEKFFAWVHHAMRCLEKTGYTQSHPTTIDPRVFKALKILEQSPSHLILTDKDIAQKVHLSASQLDRLFIKQLGVTPHQYQERQRLEYATERILYSQQPIKEIAFELGFSSLSHFSSWLRNKINLSPRQLRSQNQPK